MTFDGRLRLADLSIVQSERYGLGADLRLLFVSAQWKVSNATWESFQIFEYF